MRISDWSSDVCSSDLQAEHLALGNRQADLLDGVQRAAVARQEGILQHEAHAQVLRLHQRPAGGLAAIASLPQPVRADRKSVVSGKSVSVRVDLGGRRIIKTKKITKLPNQDPNT